MSGAEHCDNAAVGNAHETPGGSAGAGDRRAGQAQSIRDEELIELSVVMPCLDEAETLGICIRKALDCIRDNRIRGEVVIADNGSTDGSIEIAQAEGARVIHAEIRGYGAALSAGFEAARGKYLIMGDADDSYDFSNLMPFVEKLREGSDLVMGSRFKGGIAPGAMPWHHKYIGNPVLTGILNLLHGTGVDDAHCGLRGLTKEAVTRLNLRSTGMEFASEMVLKAEAKGLQIDEVPITLSRDGRSRPPHLRSFRDGWRHLRFMMMLSPKWVLMYPGALLVAVGTIIMAVLGFGPFRLGSVIFDQHTLIAGAMFVIVGYQAVTVGVAARIFAVQQEIGPPSKPLQWGFKILNLERGLVAGALVLVAGLVLVVGMTVYWASKEFGLLDLESTIRPMLVGATLIALGSQTILMSFFCSMLSIPVRKP
ncbi:MAG: glycosyltransferase family 2 protein [Planctomycetes bacterium]|nr:glycosyltransferase family 2 protein [Planctomycetota bacterium]